MAGGRVQNWEAELGSHWSSRTMDGSLLAPLINSSRDNLPAGQVRKRTWEDKHHDFDPCFHSDYKNACLNPVWCQNGDRRGKLSVHNLMLGHISWILQIRRGFWNISMCELVQNSGSVINVSDGHHFCSMQNMWRVDMEDLEPFFRVETK